MKAFTNAPQRLPGSFPPGRPPAHPLVPARFRVPVCCVTRNAVRSRTSGLDGGKGIPARPRPAPVCRSARNRADRVASTRARGRSCRRCSYRCRRRCEYVRGVRASGVAVVPGVESRKLADASRPFPVGTRKSCYRRCQWRPGATRRVSASASCENRGDAVAAFRQAAIGAEGQQVVVYGRRGRRRSHHGRYRPAVRSSDSPEHPARIHGSGVAADSVGGARRRGPWEASRSEG